MRLFKKLYLFISLVVIINACKRSHDCDNSFILSDSVKQSAAIKGIINLRDTRLNGLPCELFYYTSIKELNLFNTGLKQLSSDIGEFQKLEKLDLSWNNIDTLPKELFNLEELVELIIYGTHNKKIQLPSLNGIEKLKKLRQLSLTSYSFQYLPKEILHIKSLETLDLSAVGLKELPEEIGNLINLKKLLIQVNIDITVLPESMKNLKDLKELWMGGTGVHQRDVDALAKALPNCDIHYNPIYGKE